MSLGQPIRRAATAATGAFDAHRFASTRMGAVSLVVVAAALVLVIFHGLGQFRVGTDPSADLPEQNISRDYEYAPPAADRKLPEPRPRRRRVVEPSAANRVDRSPGPRTSRPALSRPEKRPVIRPAAKPVRAPAPSRPAKQRPPKSSPAAAPKPLVESVPVPVAPLPGVLTPTLDGTKKGVDDQEQDLLTGPGSPLSELGIAAPVPLP